MQEYCCLSSTNISSIVKLHLARPIPLSLFHFDMFESLYKGASVLLLASVTDVMELVVYDGKKKKHASLSVLTS